MRKSRTPGSVRGVSGNGYPYRDNKECRSCPAVPTFTPHLWPQYS